MDMTELLVQTEFSLPQHGRVIFQLGTPPETTARLFLNRSKRNQVLHQLHTWCIPHLFQPIHHSQHIIAGLLEGTIPPRTNGVNGVKCLFLEHGFLDIIGFRSSTILIGPYPPHRR